MASSFPSDGAASLPFDGTATAPSGGTLDPNLPPRRPRDRRRRRRRARTVLIAQVSVVAVAVAGIAGFTMNHRQVVLDVDGSRTEVSTYASTVKELLAAQDVIVTDHDLVAPGPDQSVPFGGEIVVRRARQIDVTVDGSSERVWTTATTVGEVVADLGIRTDGALTSISRSARVESAENRLQVSTLKTVQVLVDGEVVRGQTAAATVRTALSDLGVVLADEDKVSVDLDSPSVDGLLVQVSRPVAADGTKVTTLNFKTVQEKDDTMFRGEKKTIQQGKAGTQKVTYRRALVNGVEVDREIVAKVVVEEPVDEIVRVGTRKVPDLAIPSDPTSAKGIALALVRDRGWGDDQFACLDSLWTKESGWNPNAHNASSGAHGIPQALPGSKMASVGSDWATNPATQIRWGLGYIQGRYGTPCAAWAHSQSSNWY